MKILIYDLEVSPILMWAYEPYDARMMHKEHDYFLLSFAYKWLGEKQIVVKALPDYDLYKKDKWNDRDLVKDLHAVLSQADVVLGHNMAKFDTRKSNARMIAHGLSCPSQPRTIDTLRIARSKFAFTSNKLGDLAEFLGVPQSKLHVDAEEWIRAIHGDEKVWAYIKKYNKRDIEVTFQVYNKLKTYMTNHPNLGVEDGGGCPSCGSINLTKRGVSYSQTGVRQRYQCKDCASWSQDRQAIITTEIR